MNDLVDRLLDALAAHGIREFLAELDERDVLIADPALVAGLRELLGEAGGCAVVPAGDALAEPGLVDAAARQIVWSGEREPELVAALDRLCPGSPTLGLITEVLPRRASGRPVDALPRAARRGYAILAPPRTGSYFLCGLLRELGFGRPDEHLDHGLCRAARLGAVDLRLHLDRVAGIATAGGWFGTKLISSALFEAFESGFPPNDFVDWLQEHRLPVILLNRRDKVAQAVSFFVARQTGVWTLVGETRRPEPPPYDFDAIHADYRDLCQQDRWIEDLLRLLPVPIHRLLYEDLEARTEDELARVVGFLTGRELPAAAIGVRARTRKQRGARTRDYVERFRSDLAGCGG
jgi:LPS sulfotransferase NodH